MSNLVELGKSGELEDGAMKEVLAQGRQSTMTYSLQMTDKSNWRTSRYG